MSFVLYFFFFNDTATTEIYTLSLHDALPISDVGIVRSRLAHDHPPGLAEQLRPGEMLRPYASALLRGGEHDDHARRARKFLHDRPRREQDRRDARLQAGGRPPLRPAPPRFPWHGP